MQPEPSQALRAFAVRNGFGSPFTAVDDVWRKYFEPTFNSCHRLWDAARGSTNQAGDVFDFELGLVDRKTYPNAICGYDGDCHHILLYHTLPMCLLEFFYRLLCFRVVLPDIGHVSGNFDGRGDLRAPPGFSIFSGEVRVGSIEEVQELLGPRSLERQNVALELYTYALQYVVEHEMSHAMLGHVHYVQRELGLGVVNEFTMRRAGRESSKLQLYSFLEGQADKGSSFRVISDPFIERTRSANESSSIDQVRRRVLAGAFLGVFWIVTDILRTNGDMSAYKAWTNHPSSLARALAYVLMPLTNSRRFPPKIEASMRQGTVLACEDLLKLADDAGLFRPFRWLVKPEMYGTLIEPHVLADKEQGALRQKLKQYKYSNLPEL